MIYTVTFNPSIDYIVKVDEFKKGSINRSSSEDVYPGGKGINVSRVLNNLGVKSRAFGFLGGFTGEFVKNYLSQEGIETDFTEVKENTRINVKLKSVEETEINGRGPSISEEELNSFLEKISRLESGDFVVLAGNVQKNLPYNIYASIMQSCQHNSVKFVVDAVGEALRSALIYKPFLVKPNKEELGELFGIKINGKEDIIYYGTKLIEHGAENVIISMAGEGAILICEKGIYHAEVPGGIVKNSVGAGDSLIGGFLANYSVSNDIIEAFKWGAAAGSATAFSLDLCVKDEVEALVNLIKVTKFRG